MPYRGCIGSSKRSTAPTTPETYPEVVALKEKIDAISQVKTQHTVERRCAQAMALREGYVAQRPEVASVFDMRNFPGSRLKGLANCGIIHIIERGQWEKT
jgi:hypothetical protein